jgi:putative FmdB family regulatory protein
MPIYEYQCAACGAHHETIQKMSEAPLKKCPECGKLKLTRLISAPVFRLKGGGWYETDFKSDSESKRNLAGDEKPDKAEAPAKDTKPDAAKPDKPAATETKAEAPAAKAEPTKATKSASKTSKARPARRTPPKASRRR